MQRNNFTQAIIKTQEKQRLSQTDSLQCTVGLSGEVGLAQPNFVEYGLGVAIVNILFEFQDDTQRKKTSLPELLRGVVCIVITSCATGDWLCQWEMAIFDPQNKHPLADHRRNWYR